MENEKEATERGKGCAMILFIIAPGVSGTWTLYGPGLGLLSVPLWLIISIAITKIFWGKSKIEGEIPEVGPYAEGAELHDRNSGCPLQCGHSIARMFREIDTIRKARE